MIERMRVFRRAVFLLGTALLGSVAIQAHAAQAISTAPCTLSGIARTVRCAVLDVPENPAKPDGRRLAIHIAVVSASSGKPLPDPIVVLMGGPGESAISAAAIYASQFAPLLKDRDLLLVDQRGTGRSAPLNCDLYPPGAHAESPLAFFPPTAVEACRQRLETSADLTRYTFDYFARDLEDVRRGLGYAKLNMFAGSYGTRAAQVYMRAFPSSVRTAFLGSVVPIDIEGPLDFAKTEQTALDRMTANCAADPRCRAAFPHLGGELKEIVARMDSGDVRIRLPGQTAPVALARGRALEWFRSQLYRPHDAAALPWIIHRAFEGDWKPLVDGIVSGARGLKDDLSIGLFFSITCNEDMPFVREADVAAAVRGTYLGDYRLRQQQAACRLWPRAVLPEGYRSPVHSSVPTLFVTGDQDGGTPLWFTPHVAKNFSRRAIVVVRGQGHTEWNGCVAGKYEDLVRRGSVAGLQTTACPAIPLPPFKT